VQTADASGALPTSSEAASRPAEAATADREESPKAAAEIETAKPEADPNSTKHDEAAASDEKPASEKPAEAQPNQIADSEGKPAEAAKDQSAKPETETVTNEAAKPSDSAVASAPSTPTAEAAKAKMESDGQGQKPAETAQAPAPPPSVPLKDDLKSDFAKTAFRPSPAFAFKSAGQIAVFVSRKDSKLYIRQDFAPLFNIPVTIAADARPLGTHIFTAQVDGHDANVLHWSVVSLPAPAKAERRVEEERSSRGRKFASNAPIEAKPLPAPDSPGEALDRLNLPAEVMAKIYEAVSTGGSIIVSDQGIAAGETGEGTDFIVSLH
jgi:hypothetical protein